MSSPVSTAVRRFSPPTPRLGDGAEAPGTSRRAAPAAVPPDVERLRFFSGDTTSELLRGRWAEILPKYKHVIHECTFLGPPGDELDESTRSIFLV